MCLYGCLGLVSSFVIGLFGVSDCFSFRNEPGRYPKKFAGAARLQALASQVAATTIQKYSTGLESTQTVQDLLRRVRNVLRRAFGPFLDVKAL